MPRLRHSVRVLLLDQDDRLLLFRAQDPISDAPFWFPSGGGIQPGEDAQTAAVREVAEERGLVGVALGAEVWHRRHVFTWRGVEWDQRERWFLARVAHFEPDGAAFTDDERVDLTAWRSWTTEELDSTYDDLVPRDLPVRLRALIRQGPPARPTAIGA
jgi:8-oxo-dGTP pyrophosphatase MutT (NUDIX family)